MLNQYPLKLVFGEGVDDVTRRRIDYAFKTFCALYGCLSVQSGDCPRICYRTKPKDATDIALAASYTARSASQPAREPTFVAMDSDIIPWNSPATRFPCFHKAGSEGQPDWLGETFEWISGAHELSILETDPIGRVPYAETLHGKWGLDPKIPYAAIAMRGLNYQIRSVLGDRWYSAPLSPWGNSAKCVIAATHDIDFLPVSGRKTLYRFLKNLVNAAVIHRDPKLFLGISWSGLMALLRGSSPLNRLEWLCQTEQKLGINSTWNVMCKSAHPRDAWYQLNDPKVQATLNSLVAMGMEIGVHGSYTSLDKEGGLSDEYRNLRQAGYPAVGGRQHWLRFNKSKLFEELRDASAWYDCSIGYAGHPGFRRGACFPFPPYDFKNEFPYPFLELPLAVMDVALYSNRGKAPSWTRECEIIMSATRTYGWGGTSLLWHDTVFGGAQLPQAISDLYWQMKRPDEKWLCARDLVSKIWPRFSRVGLLPNIPSWNTSS